MYQEDACNLITDLKDEIAHNSLNLYGNNLRVGAAEVLQLKIAYSVGRLQQLRDLVNSLPKAPVKSDKPGAPANEK